MRGEMNCSNRLVYCVGSKRSYLKNQLDTLSGALPNYNSAFAYNYRTWFVPAPLFNPMGKVRSGLAIFSKFLPSECIRYSFKSRFPWPKNLFMPTRCFILERFHLDNGKDLLLINTHNSTFDDGSLRRIELEALKSLMLEEFQKGNYVVTGGDWNSNPPGYMINTISNGDVAKEILPRLEGEFLPAGWKWAFDPLMPTNRDVDQSYVKGSTKTTIIDFFALSPNIELLSVKTVNTSFEYTDHNPVLLQFRLAE